MRGVVSAGMVTALHERHLHDVFDLVVGSSAGALAGAYFLAGTPEVGTSIYYEDLVCGKWLKYRRALARSPILAFDYLFDELMSQRKVLDCNRVLSSAVPLYAIATRLPEYKPAVLSDFSDREALIAALRASARLPVIAGKPESLPCGEYVDGSLTEAIPVSSALALGATHVLVLRTRPAGQRRRDPGALKRRLAMRTMNRLQAGLGDAFLERAPRYAEDLQLIERLEAGEHGGATAYAIQLPREATTIRTLEQDPAVLRWGAAAGAAAVDSALGEAERLDFEPVSQRRVSAELAAATT
jgi:predicted patatin/cPLA2 family phospholipase